MSLQDETALSAREASRLEVLERTIRAGLGTFYEVGNALAEISERRLYRLDYATFDDYCRERWQMGRHMAYRLISAAAVRNDLLTIGDTPLPQTESQARELLRAPPEDRAAVMVAAHAAGGGAVTAELIGAAIDALGSAVRDEIVVGGALRARGQAIESADSLEKRARDLARLAEKLGTAARIAERYGLLAMASSLRRWVEKARGEG